jgi:hypothetical protein
MPGKKETALVAGAAVAALAAKLVLSYHAFGTNDMTTWVGAARIMRQAGTFRIYSLVGLYNQPPLFSWLLLSSWAVALKTAWPFPYVFRLLPIFADLASVFIVWELARKREPRSALWVALLCALNPVNFLISGFHGHLDTVFILFVLLAVHLAEQDRIAASGLAYGLSVCIKIVPAVLAPVFLLRIQGRRNKLVFAAASSLVFLAVFLPYLVGCEPYMVKNIFLYQSDRGVWGIWHVLLWLGESGRPSLQHLARVLVRLYGACGLPVFLLLILTAPALIMRRKGLDLIQGIFLSFCTFLAFTPGFGVQYLSWLSLFSIMVLPLAGSVYALIGAVFLCRVYAYWGGARPPYYANLWATGFWTGLDKDLDLLLWGTVLIMLAVFFIKTGSRSSASPPRRS